MIQKYQFLVSQDNLSDQQRGWWLKPSLCHGSPFVSHLQASCRTASYPLEHLSDCSKERMRIWMRMCVSCDTRASKQVARPCTKKGEVGWPKPRCYSAQSAFSQNLDFSGDQISFESHFSLMKYDEKHILGDRFFWGLHYKLKMVTPAHRDSFFFF